jgi:hypothetical protein
MRPEGLFAITILFISSNLLLEHDDLMFGDSFFDAHTAGNHVENHLIESQGFIVREDNET